MRNNGHNQKKSDLLHSLAWLGWLITHETKTFLVTYNYRIPTKTLAPPE